MGVISNNFKTHDDYYAIQRDKTAFRTPIKLNNVTFTAALPANHAVTCAPITTLLSTIHPKESEY